MKTSEHVSLSVAVAVLLAILVLAVHRVLADEIHADYIEGEKSAALVTQQMKDAVSFLGPDMGAMMHALRLQMTKYDLDMKSQAGRRAWHGKLVGEEIYTNELVKVEIYSNEVDGVVWRYRMPFKPLKLKPISRTTSFSTNGIPARLAAARARRAQEIDGGPVVTNIETVANSPSQTTKEN